MAIAALAVFVLAIAVVGFRFTEARQVAHTVVAELQPAADDSAQLLLSFSNMERGVRTYVLNEQAGSLGDYNRGVLSSEALLADLRETLPSDQPALLARVDSTAAARTTWIDKVAKPTIAAVRAGRAQAGQTLLDSDMAISAFALLQAEGTALDSAIDTQRNQAFSDLQTFTDKLAVALLVTALAFLILMLVGAWLLRRWVLKPLDDLRRQLRSVGSEGDHERPIIASGPPELYDAGNDAEQMRRRLVAEIDEARMAREGLEQEGPVVAAIRAELSRPEVVHAPNLDIFGSLQPAEGVLAGDWWDAVTLPDGRTSIIVADISGHGPQAGIAGLRLKLSLVNALKAGITPEVAIRDAARLFDDALERFATCAIVTIDPHGTVQWCNAGHLSPLILSSQGTVRELDLTGPLISSLGGDWIGQETSFAADDVLLVFTDGLSESHDAGGVQLGEADFDHALVEQVATSGDSPSELVPALLANARRRSVDWKRDDVTLVAARLAPSSPA